MRTAVLVGLGTIAALALVGLPGAAAAPVPKHLQKAPAADTGKLQGKWKVEALQLGGKDVLGAGQNFDIVVEFRGDALAVAADIGGGAQKTTATVKHNPAGAKRFTNTDERTVDRNGKPINSGAGPDLTFGYTFDGDKLVLAVGVGDAKPAADPLKPGPNDIVIVLVRAK
jgi:uncharacterized protein (TIGR03067 family)